MRFDRKISTALGLAALLACSDKIIEPPEQPPSQPPPSQQTCSITINSSPILNINEHDSYQYTVQASRQSCDSSPLSYNKVEGPSWLSFSNFSNNILGNPPEVLKDSTFPVKIRVANGQTSKEQSWNLTVKNLYNVHILSQNQANTITSVNNSTISFSQPVNFAVNDVIGAGISTTAPSGFLREVAYVSSDRKTINTKHATLDQVVDSASISHSRELSPSSVQSFTGLPGISMSPANTNTFKFGININNVVLYDFDGDSTTTWDQLIATGNISFNTSFDFDLSIKKFNLERLLLQNITVDSADITIGSNILGIAQLKQINLAQYTFQPIILGYLPTIIPMPVIVVPKLDVSIGINPTKVNPISINVKQSASLTTKLSYDAGWLASVSFFNSFDYSIFHQKGDWGLAVYAGPTLKLPLYGVAGPFAGVGTGLKFTSLNGNWKLYGGLNAFIGADVQVLGKKLTAYAKNVLEYEKLLAEGSGITNPPDSTFIDSRDGSTYKFVKIGNQTWMAENLNYDSVGSSYYNNNSSYGEFYGRLYDWSSSKIACPSGWHLPVDGEWRTLFNSLGGTNSSTTGGKMKTTGTREAGTGRWYSPNTGATNESRFAAQPGGKKENGIYSKEGYSSYFWVSTQTGALAYALHHDAGNAGSSLAAGYTDGFGFSIRCIRN